MYMRTGGWLGKAPGPVTTLRMRKDECPTNYGPRERYTSRTPRGSLNPDVTQSDGRLLIADFAVNSSRLKDATKREKLLREWLDRFEREPSYRIRILGYSDCIGLERNDQALRLNRAKEVCRLLGKSARSRVQSVGAAAAGAYVPGADNITVEGRAKNRGAVIEFWQEIQFEPEVITGKRPVLTIPDKTKEQIEDEERAKAERRRFIDRVPTAPVGKSPRDRLRAKGRDHLRSIGVPERAIDRILDLAEKGLWSAVDAALSELNLGGGTREAAISVMKSFFTHRL